MLDSMRLYATRLMQICMQATPAKERVKRWTKKELKLFEDAFISLGEGRVQEARSLVSPLCNLAAMFHDSNALVGSLSIAACMS